MTWVNELPTESGLYWSWSREARPHVTAASVSVSARGLRYVRWDGTAESVLLEALRSKHWWWWGPLPTPAPPPVAND